MFKYNHNRNFYPNFLAYLRNRPQAYAMMHGSDSYPNIQGYVRFYRSVQGILVAVEMINLPTATATCTASIFALHIHEGESCTNESCWGNMCPPNVDPFADVRMHYNPHNCRHPYHAGDLPPVFGANGYAFSVFLTDRFTLEEIIGRTVVLHADFDDFTTQPSGNAGEKIACGEIRWHT